MFAKVLVPLDGSEAARKAVQYVVDLTAGQDVPLVLLTVVDPGSIHAPKRLVPSQTQQAAGGYTGMPLRVTEGQPQPGRLATSTLTSSQVEERAEEAAEDHLRPILNDLTEQGVEAELLATTGETATEIVRVARREGCDLIAMSTQGESSERQKKIGRRMGSVAEEVVGSSDLPVLTIGPEMRPVGARARKERIPAAVDPSEFEAAASTPALEREPAAVIPPIRPMSPDDFGRPLEILLVEDNPGDVRLTEETLKDAEISHNLTVAGDGVEAMAMLRKDGDYANGKRPDLVLLDLGLPKKDGRDVLDEMKADSDLKAIPVVILTMSHSEEDILRSYSLQAQNYLTKPIGVESIKLVVDSIQQYLQAVARINASEMAV